MYFYYVFKINELYLQDMTDTSYKRIIDEHNDIYDDIYDDNILKSRIDLETWIYVEGDNPYIARSLIYFYYNNCKNLQYIGKYTEYSHINPPIHIFMDGYSKEIYETFKMEYSYDFNE